MSKSTKRVSKKSEITSSGNLVLVIRKNVFLLVVLVIITVFGCIFFPRQAIAPKPNSANEPNPSNILTSLDSANTPAFSAQIKNVTESDAPDPAFTLVDGETLLQLDITITNKTSNTQDLIPVNQLYIRTPEGDYAPLHPSIRLTNPLPSTKLLPGNSISGQLSFAVAKLQARPLLYVDLGWNNQVPVVFDVSH